MQRSWKVVVPVLMLLLLVVPLAARKGLRVGNYQEILTKAHSMERAGKFKKAIELLQNFVQVNRRHAVARIELARLLQRYDSLEYARAHLEVALTLDPSNDLIYTRLVKIYAKLRRIPEAIRTIRRGLKQVSPWKKRDLWVKLGLFYYADHRQQMALKTFLAVASRFPGSHQAQLYLGHIYFDLGRFDESARHYERVLKSSAYRYSQLVRGYLIQTYVRLHKAAIMSGDRAKALLYKQKYLAYLNEVLGRRPQMALDYYRRGNIYSAVGDFARAIRHYKQAIELDPQHQASLNNLGWLLVTAPNRTLRNPRQGLVHARRCVELNRWKTPNYIDSLAEAYYQNGLVDQAIETVKKAVLLKPFSAYYLRQLRRFERYRDGYPTGARKTYLRWTRPDAHTDP